MKKWQIVVIGAILVFTLSVTVNGYVYDFQDSDISDWSAVISGTAVTTITSSFDDIRCIRVSKLGDGRVINSHSYPTTYWAATAWMQAGDDHFKLYLYDEAVTYETGISASTTDDYSVRREIYYRGGNLYQYYTNGVLGGNLTASAAYYLVLGSYDGGGTGYAYFDDIVIGSGEEKDVVSCPPQEWFFGYDIFEPLFSGLYSAPGTLEYQHDMHISYANDDGGMTLVMSNVETSAVVNTTTVSDYCGIVTYNLTNILIDSGADYGFYRIESSGHSASDTFVYKGITTSGTDVAWDDTTYTDGETATMTYTISATHWVPATYKYYLKILSEDLSEQESWEITTQPSSTNQSVVVDNSTFPADGNYYAALYAVDRSSLEEIFMVYDTAYMDVSSAPGAVVVEGTTYDAVNSSVLGDCTVTATQLGSPTATTSNSIDGSYQIATLIDDFSIGMNASKTNWTCSPVYFTPADAGTYIVDLGLIPTGGPSPGAWGDVTGGSATADSSSGTNSTYWNTSMGTGAGGFVYEGPYWNLGGSATVTLSNASWNTSTITNDAGWWQLDESDGLADNETYTISAAKTGWQTATTSITVAGDEFTRKDIYMYESWSYSVLVKDAETSSFITDTVTVVLGSTSVQTTDGTAEFSNITMGSYSIDVSCEGYYAATGTVAITEDDDSTTVYLEKEDTGIGDSGPGSNYPPHMVRITYVDTFGNPIDGASVTATPQASSTPWTWVTGAFGFDTSQVDIQNETLNGTTGSDGTITFLMLETVQYSVNCLEAGAGINHTFSVFPKESEYFIRIGTLPVVTAYPEYNLTAYDLNATHVRLSMNYTDTANQTTSARFIVENITGSEVYNASVTLTNGSGTAYYDVNNTKGDSYTYHFEAVNTQHGTITSYLGIDLKGTGRLVEFGWPALWYYLFSFGCLFMLAGAFGEMDIKIAGILVPLIGAGIFWYIGWLPANLGSIIFVAVFVGVFYYMRAKLPAVTDG